MSRFSFRLNRILELSGHLKRDRQREVKDLSETLKEAERLLAELTRARWEASQERGTMSAGDLAMEHLLEERLQRRMDDDTERLNRIEAALADALERLYAAYGEEKALGILRERAKGRWTLDELRRVQNQIDDFAGRASGPDSPRRTSAP